MPAPLTEGQTADKDPWNAERCHVVCAANPSADGCAGRPAYAAEAAEQHFCGVTLKRCAEIHHEHGAFGVSDTYADSRYKSGFS